MALQEDLNCLEVCRRTIQDVDDIKKKLKDVLGNLLWELKTAAQVRLEDYFAKEEYDRSDPAQRLLIDTKRHIPNVIKDFAIKSFEQLPDWAADKLKSALKLSLQEWLHLNLRKMQKSLQVKWLLMLKNG